MKISDMDKAELVAHMRNITHEIGLPGGRYRFSDAPTWRRAFQIARKMGLENVDFDCGCGRDKVHEFLLR